MLVDASPATPRTAPEIASGVAVTSATVVIFGEAIWDPVVLLARFESGFVVAVSMLSLALATLTTNLAANVVAPATAFSNFFPRRVSLRAGGVLTGLVGIAMMLWKLIADPSGYIFTWLIGYSALLGPIGAILICDYFVPGREHDAVTGRSEPPGRLDPDSLGRSELPGRACEAAAVRSEPFGRTVDVSHGRSEPLGTDSEAPHGRSEPLGTDSEAPHGRSEPLGTDSPAPPTDRAPGEILRAPRPRDRNPSPDPRDARWGCRRPAGL